MKSGRKIILGEKIVTQIQCKVCGWVICEDADRVLDVKILQCPNPACCRQIPNPYLTGENNDKFS